MSDDNAKTKAPAGVKVRILYDAAGFSAGELATLSSDEAAAAVAAGWADDHADAIKYAEGVANRKAALAEALAAQD